MLRGCTTSENSQGFGKLENCSRREISKEYFRPDIYQPRQGCRRAPTRRPKQRPDHIARRPGVHLGCIKGKSKGPEAGLAIRWKSLNLAIGLNTTNQSSMSKSSTRPRSKSITSMMCGYTYNAIGSRKGNWARKSNFLLRYLSKYQE